MGRPAQPRIPNHGLIRGQMPKPTEIDQVLNALDGPTLDHLKSLVNQLNDTTGGHEADINATLQAAGPSLKSIGGVLDSVGTDGPAIQQLAIQLNNLTGAFAAHQTDVRTIVDQLTRLVSQAAGKQQQFREALTVLPPTLRTAKGTLDKIPPVADKTVPLLHDLDPATRKLRSVAGNLRPLLNDLRPAVQDLRPTLRSLDRLFDYAPDLLNSAHGTLPDLTNALNNLSGPLNFLRPYTPEASGWISNWGSAFSATDSDGHYARIQAQQGLGAPDHSTPASFLPATARSRTRSPVRTAARRGPTRSEVVSDEKHFGELPTVLQGSRSRGRSGGGCQLHCGRRQLRAAGQPGQGGRDCAVPRRVPAVGRQRCQAARRQGRRGRRHDREGRHRQRRTGSRPAGPATAHRRRATGPPGLAAR